MKKLKRILALAGVIFLVLLYLITLILAITDHSDSMRMFQASVVATVIIPALLWAYSFIYRLLKKHSEQEEDSK